MKASYITDSAEHPGELHVSHAVEGGKGYAQVWYQGAGSMFHLELTQDAARQLAADLAEVANNL